MYIYIYDPGEREAADAALDLAFTHLEPNFDVFTEIPYDSLAHSATEQGLLGLSGLSGRLSVDGDTDPSHPASRGSAAGAEQQPLGHTGQGTQHFITGAGGFLQNFIYGYPGLRIVRPGVMSFTSQQPLLPPHGVTEVALRSLHLLGSAFSVQYDEIQTCVEVLHSVSPGLELRQLKQFQKHTRGHDHGATGRGELELNTGADEYLKHVKHVTSRVYAPKPLVPGEVVCFPTGPFEVAGQGFD